MKMDIPQGDDEILLAIELCRGVIPGSHQSFIEGCTCPSVALGIIDLQDSCPFHGYGDRSNALQ